MVKRSLRMMRLFWAFKHPPVTEEILDQNIIRKDAPVMEEKLYLQQRAKQTDFLPSYDVKLVVFKRMWGLLNCCHALGMYKYQNH